MSKKSVYYTFGKCFLGTIVVAYSKKGICALFPEENKVKTIDTLKYYFPDANLLYKNSGNIIESVNNYFDNPTTASMPILDLQGTLFQKRIWQELSKVTNGEVISYSELASRLGINNSVRAVASAIARNKICILVPCHRVIRKDGSLSGYRWGVKYKRLLLDREKSQNQVASRKDK